VGIVTVRLTSLAVWAMVATRENLAKSLRREEGQAFVEYALVLLVVAVGIAAVLAWTPLRSALNSAIQSVADTLGSAPGT